MKLSQTILCSWEIHLLPLVLLNRGTRWESYTMDHKVFIITSFASLVVLVLLLTNNITVLSVRVAPSTDTTGYLNNLKKQK